MMLMSYLKDYNLENTNWIFYIILVVISLFLLYNSFVINHQNFIRLTYLIVISLFLTFVCGIVQAIIIGTNETNAGKLNKYRKQKIG